MKQDDVIRAMRFLEGLESQMESFVSTGACLISSGRTIALWNSTKDELVFPHYSDSSLSSLDQRRRELVLRMAKERKIPFILEA